MRLSIGKVIFIIFITVLYIGCNGGYSAPDVNTTHYAYVFKSDNSKQCDTESGISLEEMAQELTGIKIIDQIKGIDDKQYTASCGTATGRINIYKIAKQDTAFAINKGFAELPFNLLWQVDFDT